MWLKPDKTKIIGVVVILVFQWISSMISGVFLLFTTNLESEVESIQQTLKSSELAQSGGSLVIYYFVNILVEIIFLYLAISIILRMWDKNKKVN